MKRYSGNHPRTNPRQAVPGEFDPTRMSIKITYTHASGRYTVRDRCSSAVLGRFSTYTAAAACRQNDDATGSATTKEAEKEGVSC